MNYYFQLEKYIVNIIKIFDIFASLYYINQVMFIKQNCIHKNKNQEKYSKYTMCWPITGFLICSVIIFGAGGYYISYPQRK